MKQFFILLVSIVLFVSCSNNNDKSKTNIVSDSSIANPVYETESDSDNLEDSILITYTIGENSADFPFSIEETIDPETFSNGILEFFVAYDIEENDDVYNRIIGKSYVDNPDIGLSSLSYLRIPHYDFNHEIKVGELIVNKSVSEKYINVFKELFAIEYEIEKMYLIDEFWQGNGSASDDASCHANNTSAFCYRKMTDSSQLSNHALGRAIDVNPQQNPYVRVKNQKAICYQDNAIEFIDRSTNDPHMIKFEDECYKIFEKYGFTWGGNWKNPIDYQHFEL